MAIVVPLKRRFRIFGLFVRQIFIFGAAVGLSYCLFELNHNAKCKATAWPESTEIPTKPLLILVTPTYVRASQIIHLTQLGNVLRLIEPPILWIVVESFERTEETAHSLQKIAGKCFHFGNSPTCSRINYTHISSPDMHEDKWKSRGVIQRNSALDYIERFRINGTVYFMDDDNIYSPELFEEMRKIKRIGVWPVGFLWSQEYQKVQNWRYFGPFVERPLVKRSFLWYPDTVIGWETFDWAAGAKPEKMRKFNTDMAGFAFKSSLLWESRNSTSKKAPARFESVRTFLETLFLSRFVSSLEELEPLADLCQKVLVWHVKMESDPSHPFPKNWEIPQPFGLEVDIDLKHKPRFLINKTRHFLKDDTGKIPWGYSLPPKSGGKRGKRRKP